MIVTDQRGSVLRIEAFAAALVLLVVLGVSCRCSAQATTQPVGIAAAFPNDEGLTKHPSVLFTADFESGNLRDWDDFDRNPEPLHHVQEAPGPAMQKGNHVVRLRAPAGERGGADLVKVMAKGHDRLYARWYIQYEPGFKFEAPNHGGGLFAGPRHLLGRAGHRPKGDDWFSAWIEHDTKTHRNYAYTYYRGQYQDCVDPNGKCWGDHFPTAKTGPFAGKPHHQASGEPPKLEAGRWYCVEIMLDAGNAADREEAADGILNFWIDGKEIGPWNRLWLRTDPKLKINTLYLSLFHHDGTHSEQGILIDNVVVATERVGPIALPETRGPKVPPDQ